MPRSPKKRRSLYPEPGTWADEDTTPPDCLSAGKLATDVIRDRVGYDGLGFCIFVLISADKIRDKRLAKRWKEARTAMLRVVECLEASPEVQAITNDGEDVTDDSLEI